jgi:hypothetical protein
MAASDVDFIATPNRHSRSGSAPCSSEMRGNPVRITPTVEDCDNVDDRFFSPVVDRKGKPLRQFAMQAENDFVYSRFPLEPLKILEEAVRKVVAEPLALLLVKQGAVN